MDLNENEKKFFDTIQKVVKKEISKDDAELILERSRRQIDRLIIKYNNEGEKGFIHKNRGKPNANKKDKNLIEEIENLYLTEYYDYNFEAFYEEISSKYNISYSVMLNEFKRDDIISPLAHKTTIKLYNEKMKKAIENNDKNISEEKKELFKSRQIAIEKAYIRRSSNLYSFGQEVQMDACFKVWFGGVVSALHLAVDKGTKKVLFGWFEYEEITRGYFVLLYNIIINYGIPAKIKADNRNSFSNNKNKVDTTQFGDICNILKIELTTTSSATSKANVERANKTFKDRLIAEFRHENIVDIDTANDYLNNVFIPKMNKFFSYEINHQTTKMRQNNYTPEELNLIISEKYIRIIDNASSIKFNNKYYVPVDNNTGEVICFSNKTECIVIITYDGEYWCKIENKYYLLLEIENRNLVMQKEKDNAKPVEKKIYTPPANHPWRKFKL